MKASDLFVKALEEEGVQYIFGVPGEENLDLLESLKKSDIKLVITRHEQAAGFMAATVGRLTGSAGVCLATLGPGATNLVTAAAYAQLGGMPMLMITGQKPIKSSKQGHFQIVDIVDMMLPITKYTRQIVSGDSIPSRIREALRIANEERPGAVHLELPEDIASEESQEELVLASAVRRPVAEEKSLSTAVSMIAAAKHPLLLLGAGANRKLTCKMLNRFIDITGIPFVSTQMGKGVLDEGRDEFIGNAALSDFDFVHRAVEHADVIINVGHDVVEKPPFLMRPGGQKVIHVNFSTAIVDPVYFPQVEVVGDIAHSIWYFTEHLSKSIDWNFDYFYQVAEQQASYAQELQTSSQFPMHVARVVAEVRTAVPKLGIIALDNGLYKLWFARNYRSENQNTVLLDNALATMGAGLPSAMAAKLVHPDRAVVAICGDGGFMMNSQELETAVRLELNLTVLVLTDNAYGMIKWKQRAHDFEEYGLDFSNPDFVKYAESYGANGHRVESVEQFLPLLSKCIDSAGVHLIEVPIDYSADSELLGPALKAAAALI